MARKGRIDRGLVPKTNAAGKVVWYVRLQHQGREQWFGGFDTKTKARNFYEERKKDQREKRFFPQQYKVRGTDTMGAVIARYTATLEGGGKTRSTIADERRYAQWWTNRLNGIRLNTLSAELLDEIRRELTLKGLAAQTVKHYLTYLRHVLYATIGKNKLVENPFEAVKLPKVRPSKTRYLSPEEEKLLCDTIGRTHAPWVRLAILTGMRRGEQFGLRWSEVDLEHGLLCLPSTKTGGVQYVHLNEEAKGILRSLFTEQMNRGRCGEWVFPSENPNRPLDTDNFYGRIFLPAVRTAKLDGVTWHTLRHTFASRLAMSGQGSSTIAELLRHSGLDLVRRYAHLSPTHLKAAVETVAQYGEQKPAGEIPETVIKPGMETEEAVKSGRGERI